MSFKVVASNLIPELKEKQLRELFGNCGKVTSLSVEEFKGTRICRIEFDVAAAAKAAVLLSGTPLGTMALKVQDEQEFETLTAATLDFNQTSGLGNAPAGLGALAAAHITPGSIQGMDPLLAQQIMTQRALMSSASAMAPHMPSVSASSGSGSGMGNILAATQARADEVARTVYVGNLSPQISEEDLRSFFGVCGDILYVKMGGDTSQNARYAFVEYQDVNSANTALTLSGQQLGDRCIKVGKANNPIVKPVADKVAPDRLSDAMRRVREAQERIAAKVGVGGSSSNGDKRRRSRSRDRGDRSRRRHRSRSRDKRRRSRSRSRGHRSRSRRDRDRGHRRHRSRRSRSRSRSKDRDRRKHRSRSRDKKRRDRDRSKDRKEDAAPPVVKTPKDGVDRSNMFWDGFQWHPKAAVLPEAASGGMSANAAAMIMQNPAIVNAMPAAKK